MKVGVLGEKKIVLAFKSLGISVFGIERDEDFHSAVAEIEGGNYSILFITEDIVNKYKERIDQFCKESLPAVLIIPGADNQGVGKESLKKTIERALGSDISL